MKPVYVLAAALLLAGSLPACRSGAGPTTRSSPTPADNSRTALDWPGVYRGVVPCADCEGIETIVTLSRDNTYTVRRRYMGKDDRYNQTGGTFTWQPDGNRILLKDDAETLYQVGENRLFQLDQSGNRITGNLAGNYELTKLTDGLTERYWKLTELNGKPVPPPAGTPAREPHLILRVAENRLNGSGGCNTLLGSYELLPNNRIRFPRIATTQMACADMATEDAFLQALNTVDSYVLTGDTLVLNRARMAPLARLVVVYTR